MARFASLCLVATVLTGCSSSDGSAPGVVERPEWGEAFAAEGVAGTFVLREVGADTTYVWNPQRAEEPRRPASTFKILNSLIILETGVLTDVDDAVAWDGTDHGLDIWNRDHSLRTGIEVSAVWAYQELARQVGPDDMARLVAAAGYGNADIGGAIDRFWLDGDLRISPLEQLDFLERLLTDDLPFRAEHAAAMREILVREVDAGWTWRHKTGTALAEDPTLGWLVGTSHYDGRAFVFAMNIDLAPIDGVESQIDPLVRQLLTLEILAAEGAAPALP